MTIRKLINKGDKVRCIDAKFFDGLPLPVDAEDIKLPEFGKIYTVRDVVKTKRGVGIRLEEIRNREFYFGVAINPYC